MTTNLSSKIQLHAFPDPAALAESLAATVAGNLRDALAARGPRQPRPFRRQHSEAFLQALSRQPLSWQDVVVTLVDERWVPESNKRSNARLLRENLLRGAAAQARFLPLYRDTPEPGPALPEIERDLAGLPLPFDALVLGMGNDGHTASFFPGGDRLADALDPATPARVLPMRAPDAGEPRITLTLPPILAARPCTCIMEGAAKLRVLEDAVAGTGPGAGYPVRGVLQHAAAPVQVFYSA